MIRRLRAIATLALLPLAAACSDRPVSRIVLVTFDTTRADHLGCYGDERARTPALDGLAAEGTLFENAVSPVPTTLPAHTTLFTGLYPQDHGVRYNMFYRLSDEAETLAESLQQAGFATAAFPASHIVAERFGLAQGFDTWVEPPLGKSEDGHPIAELRPAEEGVDLALEWIEEHGDGPLFVWLHFYDPHWPYEPPFPYSSEFRDRPYDGEIAYTDAQFGRLLAGLREDPAWASTLVIATADHGEGLYDHGERYHSTLIYETTQAVPLIVRVPGEPPARIDEAVHLADLMPTILDLAGVAPPREMRGISLRPALGGGRLPARDLYFETLTGAISYGWAELFGVRYDGWKLIESNDPELYDLTRDPGELENLASTEPARLAELRQALEDIGQPMTSLDSGEEAVVPLDPETEAMLASLGYVAGGTTRSNRDDAPHPRDFVDLEPELLAAQESLARGGYARTEAVCRYVLERDPTNLWALGALAQALAGLERHEEALLPARRLVEINPEAEAAHAGLATAYMSVNRPAEAGRALEAGLQAIPGSERLTYLSLVAAWDAGDDPCGARTTAAIAAHPDSARMRILQARCQARDGRPEAALATLQEAVDLGFTRLEMLEHEPEFAAVVALEGFAALRP